MIKSGLTGSSWLQAKQMALVGESQHFAARTVKEHMLEMLRRAPVATTMLYIALFVGYIQGWLKLQYGSWTTFAFDVPILASLIFSITENRDRKRIVPDTPVAAVLVIYVCLCWIYAVASILFFQIPPLAVLAGTRAWTLFVLCYLQGYHLFRSVKQLEVFWIYLILLTLGVTYYGMNQTPEEIRAMMRSNPEISRRLSNQFMAGKSGGVLRVFSTFISSAAYASAIVIALYMLTARIASRTSGWIQKLGLLAISALFVYAIFRSGSRSSFIALVVGLVIMFSSWRGLFLIVVPSVGVVSGALWIANMYVGGIITERFSTLLDADTFTMRAYIAMAPMVSYLQDNPLGGGIGRSGAGVPMIFMSIFKTFEGFSADSGLGCLGIDMGIIGLFACLLFLGVSARRSWVILRQTQSEPLSVVTLPSAIGPIIAFATSIVGNPFIGIPHAAITWMLLGAVERIFATRSQLLAIGGKPMLDADERMVTMNSSYAKRRAEELLAESAPPPLPGSRQAGPKMTSAAHAMGPSTVSKPAPGASGKSRYLYSNLRK